MQPSERDSCSNTVGGHKVNRLSAEWPKPGVSPSQAGPSISAAAPARSNNAQAPENAQQSTAMRSTNQDNPSANGQLVAPKPSAMSEFQHENPKTQPQVFGGCACRANKQDVCQRGNSREDFKQGNILSVWLHVSDRYTPKSSNGARPHFTNIGPPYSKRRPVVVLHVFHSHMECLPFYTHRGNDLADIPEQELPEWISVVNVGDNQHLGSDENCLRLAVELWRKPVDPGTSVHVTESVRVDCNDRVDYIGRSDKSSFEQLVKMRVEFNEKAEDEPW